MRERDRKGTSPRTTGADRAGSKLDSAQDALVRGAWDEARRLFAAAVESAKEDPDSWAGLGLAAWWQEDYATSLSAREEAFRLYQERNDPRGMARMAFYLALDHLDHKGQPAVAAGWLARARRVLDGLPPTPELAMVLLLEGNQVLMGDNDTTRARALASEAIDIARKVGPPDAEALGLAMEGLSLVSEGEVMTGMRLLDEATVTALSGGLTDLNVVGTTCCYLIHACERVRDLERAAQWCERMKAFCIEHNFTSMFTVCRTQYATVLMLRGSWDHAEEELAAATGELRANRPASIASALIRMAELRRRQGRLVEAAELFAQAPSHRLALLGRAELALSRGNLEGARDLVEQYLRRFPKETRTERVVGLDLSLRIAIAAGDAPRAVESLAGIQEAAAAIGTDPLRAAALVAEGLVARSRGALVEARPLLEDGADLLDRCGIPYECAAALVPLARTLQDLGRDREALAQANRALEIARRLGAEDLARQAEDLVRATEDRTKAEPPSPPVSGSVERAVRGPLTDRELEVLRMVARGLSEKEIAEALFLSRHTVHRHVANILTKLDVPTRAAAVAQAGRMGWL